MEKVLVSVVIPAYNCGATICQAVDSALMQDVPLEVLVIEDLSESDLSDLMQERYGDEPRVRYLPNETRLGVAQTRNRGVQLAQGAYVAFLDADDFWVENKLKKQLDLMEKTGCVLCSTARELMDEKGKRSGHVIAVDEEYSYKTLLKNNQINCSSVLIKTEVAREFPMRHDEGHEDYITWLSVLKKYEKGCGVNEPLLLYRVSSSGKSGSKLHSAKMTYQTYRYMGFGPLKAGWYFVNYAFYGVKKYFFWFVKRGRSHEA